MRTKPPYLVALLFAASVCACMPHREATALAELTPTDLDLAAAAGARLAEEQHSALVVWPVFGHPWVPSNAVLSEAQQLRIANAVARGGKGTVVDTTAWRTTHPIGATTTPEQIVLLGGFSAQRDSGWVDTLNGGLSSSGTYDMTQFRYVFIRDGGTWKFLHRVWMGSS